MKNIDMKLKWIPVLKQGGSAFEYSDKKLKENLSNSPAIYRWRLEKPDGTIQRVYIGATGKLLSRVRTHRLKNGFYGLRKRFGKFKGKIYLDTLQIEEFYINNRHYSARSLRVEYKRQLIERIILCMALNQGYKILNKGYE